MNLLVFIRGYLSLTSKVINNKIVFGPNRMNAGTQPRNNMPTPSLRREFTRTSTFDCFEDWCMEMSIRNDRTCCIPTLAIRRDLMTSAGAVTAARIN
jgi:hypothetical protein